MPRYRILEDQSVTYAYIVEAEDEDAALEIDLSLLKGKELDWSCNFISIEKIDD